MAKPLVIKTVKRIILSLIGVAILAGMFWYINTYIYEFYASSPTIDVESVAPAQVAKDAEFDAVLTFSNAQITAIDAIDLVVSYDKDKLSYQDSYSSIPTNYFKATTGTVTDLGSNRSQVRILLLASENVEQKQALTVNLKFKALNTGTATITVETNTEIAGTDSQGNAVTYAEDLDNASKQVVIESTGGSGSNGPIAHWKMDENVQGNNQTIVDSVGNNNVTSISINDNAGINCTTEGKNEGSCTFNGNNRLQGKTTLNFGTKMTVMAWIKTQTGGAIFASVSSPLVNSFYMRTNGNFIEGVSDMSSNWPNNSVRGKTNVIDNQWHHVTFVIDDLNAYAYVDGNLDGQDTMQSMGAYADNNWFMGYSDASWSPHNFRGQMDDVKLFNYALTQAEIISEAGITPTGEPSPSVDPSPSAEPTPTPPWENTNYDTTTVYGIVQSADENGELIAGKYWRKDESICANADYNNASNMSVNANFLDQCEGFNNIPYFLTVVQNPGNNLAYQLQNIPEGYECVGWEHRLRIKSDGSPFKAGEGTGCNTGPLNINVNDAESSYNNSHFILFKMKQIIEPTPTSPLEQFESVLNMKVRFQGIPTGPREQYRKLDASVTLKGGGQEVKTETIEFTAQEDGTWNGSMGVDGINSSTKYEIIIKGAKHLAKKICANNPSEALGGTYRCSEPEMNLQEGNNDLSFTGIILLGGDLPQQDGLINAMDFAFIRQNLGSQDGQNLIRGDLNLDGIIDTQDHTIIKTALDFKYDEE